METQKQERGVKKVTKIIALASIFSFILTYSSFISSLQQRLHLLSMYSKLVDKKYIFLLCNGIVGLILGNFRENFETLLHGKSINTVEEKKTIQVKAMRESEARRVVAILGEKSTYKVEEDEKVALSRGESEVRKAMAVLGEKGDFKEEEEEVAFVVDDDNDLSKQALAITIIDDHGDEINDGLLSSEELNKKCEDFIRKMKAKIRLESRKLVTS